MSSFFVVVLFDWCFAVEFGARFNVVQVGKYVGKSVLKGRATKYVAPENFYAEAKTLPPYRTASSYDAKLWQFIKDLGKAGDIIWNVAGHDDDE